MKKIAGTDLVVGKLYADTENPQLATILKLEKIDLKDSILYFSHVSGPNIYIYNNGLVRFWMSKESFYEIEEESKPPKSIQVIHVTLPTFVHNDVTLPVIAKMFKNLTQFEAELTEMANDGYTKCIFYSLETMDDGRYIIRRRYVKNEPQNGENLRDAFKAKSK